jgi:DNA-binding CsgD family transcriptional regulator
VLTSRRVSASRVARNLRWRVTRCILVVTSGASTARERELAALIAEAMSNEQMAGCLVLTRGTVANHVAHIIDKMQVHTRVQIAVRVAVEKHRTDARMILALLMALRAVDGSTLRESTRHATNPLATAAAAEKVDALSTMKEPTCLWRLGPAKRPGPELQRHLGSDRLPLRKGGRAAWVFREKRAHRDGHVEDDDLELAGIRRDLAVRSTIAGPFEVAPAHRGVSQAASRQPDHFSEDQVHLLQFVVNWVGLVARDRSVREIGPSQRGGMTWKSCCLQ